MSTDPMNTELPPLRDVIAQILNEARCLSPRTVGNIELTNRIMDALAARSHRPAGSDDSRGGWQPIETAPRDGTSVLGYWMAGQHDCAIHATKFFKGGWWEPNEDYRQSPPTHWQPLPGPPKRMSLREAGYKPRKRETYWDADDDAAPLPEPPASRSKG